MIKFSIFIEPGSSPRNVHVRPLSSSTMVIQWDEPEAENGPIEVRYYFVNVHYRDILHERISFHWEFFGVY